MKTVYVATFSQGNYGSALQAISLQYTLKELGNKPCLIVAKPVETKGVDRIVKELKARFWPEKHYGIIKKIRKFLERYEYEEKRKKIIAFCSRYAEYVVIDIDHFNQPFDPEECIYLAGSDQVWNIIDREIQPIYKFDYINHTKYKCFSYAASIGLDKLTDEQIHYYERVLDCFEIISLREKSAIELFQNTTLESRLRQDIDPTLLHDSLFWDSFVGKKPTEDDYIFIYMLRPDKRLIHMAIEISRRENLKIYYTGLYSYRNKYMITDTSAGPEEFLSYVKYAKYVITNSFHGTCFSTLFHKKFVSVSIDSTGSRAQGLLEMINLKNHLIYSEKDLNVIYEDINYKMVDDILSYQRSRSYNYLREITK